MPIAVAILLAFLLTPIVTLAQRAVGRVPAVVLVATLVCAGLAFASWGLGRQLTSLADEMPRYRTNIQQKIRDVRGASRGGGVERIQETVEDIKTAIAFEPQLGYTVCGHRVHGV